MQIQSEDDRAAHWLYAIILQNEHKPAMYVYNALSDLVEYKCLTGTKWKPYWS